MTLNKTKIDLARARQCMDVEELCARVGMSRATYYNAMARTGVRAETAGKIAKALNVDVTEIIED